MQTAYERKKLKELHLKAKHLHLKPTLAEEAVLEYCDLCGDSMRLSHSTVTTKQILCKKCL